MPETEQADRHAEAEGLGGDRRDEGAQGPQEVTLDDEGQVSVRVRGGMQSARL